MKGMDIFCASQAATAICLSMDQASPSSNLLLGGSSPAIDRHNPIIRDSRRNAAAAPLPSLTPKLQKNRLKKKNAKLPPPPPLPLKQNDDDKEINIEISSKNGNASSSSSSSSSGVSRKSWSCTKPGDFISPPGSTRYLLSEKVLLNALSDFDPPLKLFPAETSKGKDVNTNDAKAKPPPSSASPDQVVVLRVSLHCRGCERKMRKHISRMEGVRSFNIDFAAKKVTVTGDVTPLEVLSSISKVKNAQLWPPTISSEFNNTAAAAAAAAAWVTDKESFVGMASSS